MTPSTLVFNPDHLDLKILALLQNDARLTMAELSRQLSLSQPAATERVRKLEDAGVISGYYARVNPERLGYSIRAIVRIGRSDYGKVKQLIEKMPEVRNAHNVTGEDSWMIEIVVKDVAHLDAVLTKFCELGETSTSIVLNTVARDRAVRP
jgi:Lrp/AsnC family transcriptional regulator, leucine-responsive regulatory protein